MEKTTVFNLIVIDESGSMSLSKEATIAGCNEVINSAKSQAKANADKERSLISIYVFQENDEIKSRYLIKNIPVADARHIIAKQYRPWGCTPLLDAVGMTLADLEAVASTHEDAYGVVTIITDGYENASKEYTYEKVARMIDRLKEKGWTFNFIGANIDVVKVSRQLNIDNAVSYDSSAEGTKNMWTGFANAEASYQQSRREAERNCSTVEEKIALRKRMSKKFFNR